MKKLLFLFFLALQVLGLAGCRDKDKEPADKARRTVLVYMVARNNLGTSGLDDADIAEMQAVRFPADCRLLVFRSTYSDSPQLLEVTSDGKLKTLKIYDSNAPLAITPEMLSQVLADAQQLAPARKRGIVFWSHSSGWKGAVRTPALTRSFGLDGGREMSIPDLASALSGASPALDFIFFDSCYMGCIEVAYELRDCARFMVGSVAEVPTAGMPYQLTVPALFDTNIRRGLIAAIDKTADYYEPRAGAYCPSTLSLIDLSKMDALAAASRPLLLNAGEIPEEVTLQRFSLSKPYKTLFVDLDHYMEAVSSEPERLAEFRAALSDAVIHERHSEAIWASLPIERCCGLTINPSPESDSYGYKDLQWTKFIYN